MKRLTDNQVKEVQETTRDMYFGMKENGFSDEEIAEILDESPYSEEGILSNDAYYEIEDIDLMDDEVEAEVIKVALAELKKLVKDVLKEDKPLTNEGEMFKNISDSLVNYDAFIENFGSIVKVLKFQDNYLIYRSEAKNYNEYIYKADNKDEIEGWLYGCVQVANGIIKPIK